MTFEDILSTISTSNGGFAEQLDTSAYLLITLFFFIFLQIRIVGNISRKLRLFLR